MDTEMGCMHRKRMGCFKDTYTKIKYIPHQKGPMNGSAKIIYRHCIGNYVDAYAKMIINRYTGYQKGQLFYEGAMGDQPNKFVEAMNLVHNLTSEYQVIERERDEKIQKLKRR